MPSEDRGWLESLKHYVSAPRRAFESLSRPIDDKQYPTEYTTASPLVNITRGDINKATEAAMAVSGGGLSTKPIRAYHSSPHDFERFDLSRIGTGEGAQAYGHGLYFAENPAVSGQGGGYWKQFLPRTADMTERNAARTLHFNKFDRDAAIADVQANIAATQQALKSGEYPRPAKYGSSRDLYEGHLRNYQSELKHLESGKPVGPRTYEVNINADPAHMLDWDKPLRSQSPEVVEGLQKAMNLRQWKEFNVSDAGTAMKQGFIGSDMRTATDKIYNAGIPGIKYLDEGSRIPAQKIPALEAQIARTEASLAKTDPGLTSLRDVQERNIARWKDELAQTPSPTSNYVVFNPSIIDIVKKYGLAGLAAPPAIAGAMNQERQP